MSDIAEIVQEKLTSTGIDEDTLAYLVNIIEELSVNERKSSQTIYESIHPFLFDGGIVSDEKEIRSISKELSIAFGGSGLQSGVVASESTVDTNKTPQLLAAPIKMISTVENRKVHRSGYMDMTIYTTEEDEFATLENSKEENLIIAANGNFLDIKAVPVTQKQLRKQRKENEQLQKILRAEAEARLKAEQELAAARMAAIKASRKEAVSTNKNNRSGAMNTNSVTLEHFSVPHPSGRGDLLSDTTLTLVSGRIYGLIGKNGVGK